MKKLALALIAALAFGASASAQVATPLDDLSLATTVNTSVAITAGNTFQTIVPSTAITLNNSTKHALTIQNNNTADTCWITFGSFSGTTITAGNATKGRSILLTAGSSYSRFYPIIPADEIEGTCATTGSTLYVEIQ